MSDYDTVWVHTPSEAYRQLGRRRLPAELADRLVAAGFAQRPGPGVRLEWPKIRAAAVPLPSVVEQPSDKAVRKKRTTRKRAQDADAE